MQCVQCRLCENACPYGAIRQPTVVPSPEERVAARRRLIAVVCAAPILIAVGAGLGFAMRGSLASLHPTVQLAEQIRLEQSGPAKAAIEGAQPSAVDAFRDRRVSGVALRQGGRDRQGVCLVRNALRRLGGVGLRRQTGTAFHSPPPHRFRARPRRLRLLRTVFLVLSRGARAAGVPPDRRISD